MIQQKSSRYDAAGLNKTIAKCSLPHITEITHSRANVYLPLISGFSGHSSLSESVFDLCENPQNRKLKNFGKIRKSFFDHRNNRVMIFFVKKFVIED